MPQKVITPQRSLAIELILFLAYSFFSASWMVGSIITRPQLITKRFVDAIK